jgi:hypothetical protein
MEFTILKKENVNNAILGLIKAEVESFEKKHHGNGLKSPFRLSIVRIGNRIAAKDYLDAIEFFNGQRFSENKPCLYFVSIDDKEKTDYLTVYLKEPNLFKIVESKPTKPTKPTKSALLKRLNKILVEIATQAAEEGWGDEFKKAVQPYA